MGRKKMVKTTKEYCQQCEYCFGGQSETALVSCDYLLKTGKRRKCPVGKCDKFKPKTKKTKKEIPWSETSNLFQKMNYEERMKATKTLRNTLISRSSQA